MERELRKAEAEALRIGLREFCAKCGHSRYVHQMKNEGYHIVWFECWECHPARLAPHGLPIAMNDWYAEKVTAARHQFEKAAGG